MSKRESFRVQKADGEFEPFKVSKLRHSLKRAGASNRVINHILDQIFEFAHQKDHITTYEIYREAFKLLQKEELGVASRYSLKRAVFDLGPTGFPFEDFIAEIYRAHGFTTLTRRVIKGKCATHEMDMVATKGNRCYGAEMKFHNSPGLKSDLKVALYVAARFEDINNTAKKKFTDKLLITNTKFTREAQKFGDCSGLTMISWSQPGGGNLQDLIEGARVHPLTCLTTLSQSQKQKLLAEGNVLCRSVNGNEELLLRVGVSKNKLDRVMAEIGDLCRN